ncbi:MAG: hypothetical protein ACHQII_00030 [Bacteroidia bacterium]
MIKRFYIVFMLIGTSVFASFQQANNGFVDIDKTDAIKLVQQVNNWFHTTPSYSFTVTHATFAGHQATVPYEQKTGYFKKFTNGFHSDVMGLHSIQNANFLISIDSAKKIIAVNNSTRIFAGKMNSMDDYIKAFDKCKTIKMAQTAKSKILRMEFEKKSAIAAYEFTIGKDGLLSAITIFYSREVKSKTGQMVKPKLSIVFEKYHTGVSPAPRESNESMYFALNNNRIELNESYKGFKLLDQRIKNEKQ